MYHARKNSTLGDGYHHAEHDQAGRDNTGFSLTLLSLPNKVKILKMIK